MIHREPQRSERRPNRGPTGQVPGVRVRPVLCAAMWGLALWAGCAAPLGMVAKHDGPVAPASAASTSAASNVSASSPATGATGGEQSLSGAEAVTPASAAKPETVPPPNPNPKAEQPGQATVASGAVRLPVVVTAELVPPAGAPEELTAETLPRVMTLAQSLQYAVDHHPRLRARQREVDVARAKLVAAGVLTNPQLVVDYDTPMGAAEGSEVSGRLMFTIPTADKMRLGKSVACAEICRAQQALKRETQVVLQEASVAAVDVLYYQELLGLQGRLSELATKQAALQQGRFQAQQIPAADAIQSDLAAKDIELRRLDTGGQLDSARVRLARAIGMGTSGLKGLSGQLVVEPLPAVSVERLMAVAQHNAPQIGEAQATLARSQRQLALERANAVPDVEVGPRSQNFVGAEGRNSVLGARLAVDLPMFDRNQGGICESAAQIGVDQALLEEATLTTLGDVASVYEELRSLQSRLQYSETKVLPLAERIESTIRENEVTRAMAPSQISGLLEEVVKMRAVYLQLRYRYATLYRQLETLLGCRLTEIAGGGLATASTKPFADEPLTR